VTEHVFKDFTIGVFASCLERNIVVVQERIFFFFLQKSEPGARNRASSSAVQTIAYGKRNVRINFDTKPISSCTVMSQDEILKFLMCTRHKHFYRVDVLKNIFGSKCSTNFSPNALWISTLETAEISDQYRVF